MVCEKKKSKLNETGILVQICKGRCFFFFDLELKHTLFYYYFGKFVLRKDWNFCDKILQAVAILNKQDKSFHLYIFNFFQIFKKLYQFEMNKKLYFRHISKMQGKVTGIIKVAIKTASIMWIKKEEELWNPFESIMESIIEFQFNFIFSDLDIPNILYEKWNAFMREYWEWNVMTLNHPLISHLAKMAL